MESERDDKDFAEAPEDLIASDDEADDYKHAKLLQSIGNLDGKKKTEEIQRTEPAGRASEFHLAPASGKVDLRDLVGTLGKIKAKKQLDKIQSKQKILNTPLPKNELDKIERNIAYESTTAEVTKWDPIVSKNRKAEQLEFPLLKPAVQLRTTGQMAKGYQPRTPLEVEVAKLLAGSKNVATKKKELTEAEERALQAMSIEEAQERRAELQKYRVLLSYKEAKARRKKKIKSKKYHRILRKEKEKTEKKKLDELQRKDPEAYADMLLKLQKERIEERMSLKHRGGSKFMKKQQLYGKFNEHTRQSVADMLEKSKELRQKVEAGSNSSDEGKSSDDDEGSAARFNPSGQPITASSNPWMSAVKPESRTECIQAIVNVNKEKDEVEESEEEGEDENKTVEGKEHANEESSESEAEERVSDRDEKNKLANLGIDEIFQDAQRELKKKAEEKQKEELEEEEKARKQRRAKKEKRKEIVRKNRTKTKRRREESESSDSDSDTDSEEDVIMSRRKKDMDIDELEIDPHEEGLSSSLKRKQTMEDFEGDWSGDDSEHAKQTDVDNGASDEKTTSEKNTKSQEDPQVDPKKYLTVSTRIDSAAAPDLIEGDGETVEDIEDQQRITIAQAFAMDDVVEEFLQDKEATAERDKPKDIDLTLPGWGEWGGSGVTVSKRKKKRFIIKAPPAPPRKDKDLKGVIISETKDTTITKHQVKNIPFPFTSVNQFEASVRAPIGKTWNPENAYRKMIQPKVVTKLGTVIDPIDKAQVFKKNANQLPESNKGDKNNPQNKKQKKGRNQQKKKKKSQ